MDTRNRLRAAGRPLFLAFCVFTLLIPTGALGFADGPSGLFFPKGLAWLNVARPLTAEDLKGKVVILDFWTYGCINCIHVVEELRQLEEELGSRLAVIGVHSPKFDNEKNLETLRNTVVRLDRRHPVVNDPDSLLMGFYLGVLLRIKSKLPLASLSPFMSLMMGASRLFSGLC